MASAQSSFQYQEGTKYQEGIFFIIYYIVEETTVMGSR